MKIRGTTQRSPLHALMLLMAVVSFAVGTALRVFAAQNDLWFDEVWTLQLLREHVRSFSDVFTSVKHSNNHHLCSLWMWLVGQNASALVYRLPSVLASIGTIVLAGLIGLRQSRLEGCIAVILTSWSYLLIHFGTEARGYSLAIFFALLAWYALQQFEERPSWAWTVLFWSAVVLGFLAHLEFAFCFVGLVAWALWRFVRYRSRWRQAVLDLFALFTVPIVLLLAFYFVAIRGMEVGGGPMYQVTPLLIKTASYMLGGPASGAAAGIAALLAVASIYVVLVYLMFERDDRWIFYAVVIVVPLGLIAILLPVPLSVRYFMISVAASLALLSSGYAALLRRGVAGCGIGLTLLALFVAGNAVNTGNLLRFGRGQYLAALRFIEAHSNDREVVITSDYDFRNRMLVNYYKRYLERAEYTRYVDRATLDQENVRAKGASLGAEWLILHRFDLTEQPERVTDIYGNKYKLVSIYRYSDLSGWNWLLYHNLNRPPVPPQKPLLQ
jgi:Dolichyl-phosphate-mannose-protein mannosyltransferase